MEIRTGTARSGDVDIYYEDMGEPTDPEDSADDAKAWPGQQRGDPEEGRKADEGNNWIGRLSLQLEHADNLEIVLQIF